MGSSQSTPASGNDSSSSEALMTSSARRRRSRVTPEADMEVAESREVSAAMPLKSGEGKKKQELGFFNETIL